MSDDIPKSSAAVASTEGPLPLLTRLENSYIPEPNSGCWLWLGLTNEKGYGLVYVRVGEKIRNRKAHRIRWEVHHGPIPEGLCVLHRCDVPGCVNPAHLFLGTLAENIADMVAKGRNRTGARKTLNGAKLGEAEVRLIRSSTANGHDLAAELGVHWHSIWRIRTRRTWQHVP